jgi:hypothetical protein
MRDAGHRYSGDRPAGDPWSQASEPVIGRLVARGLHDELAGTAYAIVDGVDGRHHHLRFDDLELTGDAQARGDRRAAAMARHAWRRKVACFRCAATCPSSGRFTRAAPPGSTASCCRRSAGIGAARAFGSEVRDAMEARAAASDRRRASPVARAARDARSRVLIDTLRSAELREAAARIAERTGLNASSAKPPGSAIAGIYRERVTLASGRFAMIDDGLGFQLVPWRPGARPPARPAVAGT